MGTITYSDTLTRISCGVCSIPFAIPTNRYKNLVETGEDFWCPNGHKIHYFDDENSRLKDELARTKTRLLREKQAHEHTEARRRAQKAATTKVKKRTAKGVCPVAGCKRHFENLEAHMASRHPHYDPEDES